VGLLLLVAVTGLAGPGPARSEEPAAGAIVPRDWLVIPPVGRYGRSATHLDAVEARIVAGTWAAPKAGEGVPLPGGMTRTWEATRSGDDGSLRHPALGGGYADTTIAADAERVMVLEASGHSMVYVNGEPRVGDPYGTGYVQVPVLLRKGVNELLFQVGRGQLKARLVPPRAAALLNAGDTTLPDFRERKSNGDWGAVVVLNATTAPLAGLILETSGENMVTTRSPLPTLPPLTLRKVAFRLAGPPARSRGDRPATLRLLRSADGGARLLDTASIPLRQRGWGQVEKRTFRSEIDGSVQYYAVYRAPPPADGSRPALFLTLHGAGVEASGQAEAYGRNRWGDLVAPTNRRPYGFDWEDWGRKDALEVLGRAQAELDSDPARTYLTGHSMGGHGVWQLGALFPDRFAAIGPSAGWISFASYGGRPAEETTPVGEILRRAASASDTLAFAQNYAGLGVYVLHGDSDDDVPVAQARAMKERLAAFHHDWEYHEQPGAGHWWDLSNAPGADCVDWPPMFDFFARHALAPAGSLRRVRFTTPSPGISADSAWVRVEAQLRPFQPSAIDLTCEPSPPLRGHFRGTTSNVTRLALTLAPVVAGGAPVTLELDGQQLENLPWPSPTRPSSRLWLERRGERWVPTTAPSPRLKGPARCGPFKEAFDRRFLLVYGTRGTAAENAWAFAKARYDAETFWYRGNGSVDVLSDTVFTAAREPDRSVVLYGNAATNAAWGPLLGASPVQVEPGRARIGERAIAGDALAGLLVRPRPGSDVALVAAVAGTGLAGMRLSDRLPYFLSGVGYPDVTVIGPEMLTAGSAGVRAAGFFGHDWSVAAGDFAWKE
jgi:dienelactone hydrolase